MTGLSHRPARSARPARGRRERGRRERGAALVEFALVVPVLVALLFAIIDFGFAYSRVLDIRHGAREGSRLAAVNYGASPSAAGTAQSDAIIAEICRRMDGGEGATVELQLPAGGSVGQEGRVKISRPVISISGLYRPLLDGKTMRSEVATRIEVEATWSSRSGTCS